MANFRSEQHRFYMVSSNTTLNRLTFFFIKLYFIQSMFFRWSLNDISIDIQLIMIK